MKIQILSTVFLVALNASVLATPGERSPIFTPLGDLLGGGFSSCAIAASADGTVVVGQGRSTYGWQAFRWRAKVGMIGLGDLPGGPFDSVAWAVNADGTVVVGSSNRDDESSGEAFVWTAFGGMIGLGEPV
ncbi:MAG: hypothetical protein M3R13_11145 [Armatimonadota bacterium]|nr:hypothetical protein [Armatimonadota bacterium]